MIDTLTPQSPGWWLARLITKLGERQGYYNTAEAYARGEQPLPRGAHEARAAYQRLLRLSRLNVGELVIEATRERMMVTGFRTAVEGGLVDDDKAWRIWQANHLDADQALVDEPALSMGDGYVIIGPRAEDIDAPVITAEDPRAVITDHDPIRRRRVRAALKCYRDDLDGKDRCHVYLPAPTKGAGAQMWTAVREATGDGFQHTASGWQWERTVQRLPDDRVPVVRFANRCSDWRLPGRSELDGSYATLDRINHMILERVVIATVQAYRQRAVKGDLPVTDGDGNEIDYSSLFAPDPGAMWLLPPTADIWESQQVDLTPVLTSVRHDLQDLAGSTRTPLYYLIPDAKDGSAEGASLAREGLIHKVLDRNAQADESWEQVMSIAFGMMGDRVRAQQVDTEVIRQPPDRHSLAERYDAAAKAKAAGVPWRTVMADVLQFSPQQVARMEAERAAEAFFALQQPPAELPDPLAT